MAKNTRAQSLEHLNDKIREFARLREWDQFHSPKNLCMALSVECAELMEHFQWLTEEQSRHLPHATKAEAATEIADVLIYLIRLSQVLDVDLLASVQAKLIANAEKYPVEKARGSAQKYTKFK